MKRHAAEYQSRGITTEDIERLIRLYIFRERDREIMRRKLIDGLTFEQVADEFGMSPRGVKYIVYRGETIIFEHI